MVSAIAGSGKTALLVAIADSLQPKNALYLAYNKSVATEASKKFPKGVHCSTTHSLAYKPTVGDKENYKLSIGFFSYRNITEKTYYDEQRGSERKFHYDQKLHLVNLIREFCLSKYTSFELFIFEEDHPEMFGPLGTKYLSKMGDGSLDCTHEFYLKMFHILLANGSLTYPPFDFIALDEAGDLNEVTLEIFKLLPATKKLMVGDPFQNIYTFNHTINCFSVMAGEGPLFPMSQSFRVSDTIAPKIEAFCQTYLSPDMEFKGVTILDNTIKSRAFISRTNASLIAKMFELNSLGIQYGLTRTAKQIFELPLILCSLKYKGFISNAEFKHLQADVNDYHENKSISETKTLLGYLRATHPDNLQLKIAISLIVKHTKIGILKCYEEARKHEKVNQSYMLGTCHSMKGLKLMK
jgi:F-box protein 18 (helicase)